MSRIGACALCRETKELRKSHFLPAGVYRATRDEAQRNPNPLKLTDQGVFQDSVQIADYLLCGECEERLNKNGERWFLAHCYRNKQFPLASILDAKKPSSTCGSITIYHAAEIPEVNPAALSYFAASMFWRASVHRWRIGQEDGRGIQLGPYEEQLQHFLTGGTEFPPKCALWISVPKTITHFVRLSMTPYGGRSGSYYLYKFVVLGVGFYLLVGGQIPSAAKAMCFVSGPGNPIYRTDMLELGILQDVYRKFDGQPALLDGPRTGRARDRAGSEILSS